MCVACGLGVVGAAQPGTGPQNRSPTCQGSNSLGFVGFPSLELGGRGPETTTKVGPGPARRKKGTRTLGGTKKKRRARMCVLRWRRRGNGAILGCANGGQPWGREPVGCPSRRDGALEPRVPEMQAGLTWPTPRAEFACTPRPPAARPPGSVFAKFAGGTGATEPSWVSRMGGATSGSRARGLRLPTGWGARAPGHWKTSWVSQIGGGVGWGHPGGRQPLGWPSQRDRALEPLLLEMQLGLTVPTRRALPACTQRAPTARPPGSVFATFVGGAGATGPSWVTRMGGRPPGREPVGCPSQRDGALEHQFL